MILLDWLRIQHYAEDGAQPEYRRGWNDAIGHVERFVSGAVVDVHRSACCSELGLSVGAGIATAPAVAARDTATISDELDAEMSDVEFNDYINRKRKPAPHGQAQDWEMPSG